MKNLTIKELLIKNRCDIIANQQGIAQLLSILKDSDYEAECRALEGRANRIETGVRKSVDDWDKLFRTGLDESN